MDTVRMRVAAGRQRLVNAVAVVVLMSLGLTGVQAVPEVQPAPERIGAAPVPGAGPVLQRTISCSASGRPVRPTG
jgi:hypothetical protein